MDSGNHYLLMGEKIGVGKEYNPKVYDSLKDFIEIVNNPICPVKGTLRTGEFKIFNRPFLNVSKQVNNIRKIKNV